MPTFSFLICPLKVTFQLQPNQNALLPLAVNSKVIASVVDLMPDYYRRSVARPVSCYALFK